MTARGATRIIEAEKGGELAMRGKAILVVVLTCVLVLGLAGAALAGWAELAPGAYDPTSPWPYEMQRKIWSKALPDGLTLELWVGPSVPAATPAWKTGDYLHVYLVERADRYEKLVRAEDGQYPPVGEAWDGSGYYRVLADCEMPAGQVRLLEALLREAF